MPIDLLSPNLGIQNVIVNTGDQTHMPDARPLASTALREAGIDELYNTNVAGKQIENLLTPNVGDGSMLEPSVFQQNLKSCATSLKNSDNPVVKNFLREELTPLLENSELLKAYTGLMIGG